jgi:hypothetical protein
MGQVPPPVVVNKNGWFIAAFVNVPDVELLAGAVRDVAAPSPPPVPVDIVTSAEPEVMAEHLTRIAVKPFCE